MKTPSFWRDKNLLSTLLLPLAWIYGVVSTAKQASVQPQHLPVPVICVGNLTAGGSGKTPVALAIGEYFRGKGKKAFFLSRGYGGSLSGPVLVDPKKHSAAETGDEPLLLAGVLPTVVARDRLAGAQFAIAQGAQLIIMDDGLQNPAIEKNLSIVVVDGQTGFGNGRLIPAGPLREALRSGFARADAVIAINPSEKLSLPQGKPILKTRSLPTDASLRGKKLLAFCGLAYPQKFFTMLKDTGAELAGSISFADHHPYRQGELDALVKQAAKANATLATTAKDAVRLPESFRPQVLVVGMTLAFEDASSLDHLLSKFA